MISCAQNQAPLDERLKRLDHLQNHSRVEFERSRHIMAMRRRSFVEEYIDGRLSLLLYIPPVRNADVPGGRTHGGGSESLLDYPGFVLHLQANNSRVGNNWQEKPVFVQNVECLYVPEAIVPSRIGLYFCHHQVDEICGEIFFGVRQGNFKGLLRRMSGELSLVANGMGCVPFKAFDPCIVEGALKIVESVPDDQREFLNSIIIRNTVFDYLVSKLRVHLDDSGVGVFQPCDSPLEISEVLIGPLDLSSSLDVLHINSI